MRFSLPSLAEAVLRSRPQHCLCPKWGTPCPDLSETSLRRVTEAQPTQAEYFAMALHKVIRFTLLEFLAVRVFGSAAAVIEEIRVR